MKKRSASSSEHAMPVRSRFCFVTLTVDSRRFGSVDLAVEAGKRQLPDVLAFIRKKGVEIHRTMQGKAVSVDYWRVLFSSDCPISSEDIDAVWGLGRINVVNWVEAKYAHLFMKEGQA